VSAADWLDAIAKDIERRDPGLAQTCRNRAIALRAQARP
jgi:hypothetical protein